LILLCLPLKLYMSVHSDTPSPSPEQGHVTPRIEELWENTLDTQWCDVDLNRIEIPLNLNFPEAPHETDSPIPTLHETLSTIRNHFQYNVEGLSPLSPPLSPESEKRDTCSLCGSVGHDTYCKTCSDRICKFKKPAEPICCSVCLSDITEGETIFRPSACDHIFHLECIKPWSGGNTTRKSCPNCRKNMFSYPESVLIERLMREYNTSEKDIQEVVTQACTDRNTAIESLLQSEGDILDAILYIMYGFKLHSTTTTESPQQTTPPHVRQLYREVFSEYSDSDV
jgi:hypothetical protein